MMHKPYVCMDLDGVVYPFVKAWHRLAAANELIHKHLARTTSVSNWGFYREYGISDNSFNETLSVWAEDLFTMCEPSSVTLDNWQQIYEDSYLHIITSRPSMAWVPTIKWLNFWDLGYHYLSVIGPGKNKADEITNPTGRPVIAIDDLPSVLADYRSAGVGTTVLKRQEYNRDAWSEYTNVSSIERVRDFMASVQHD